MVNIGSVSRVEGGSQILSARVHKTIQSIREIVGNHSDADIYVTLKESNMDPNETAQKLLNQDPFHLVKRKRDKKKESTGSITSVDRRKQNENVPAQETKSHDQVMKSQDQGMQPRGQAVQPHYQGIKYYGRGMQSFDQGVKLYGRGMQSFDQGVKLYGRGMQSYDQGVKLYGRGMQSRDLGMKSYGRGVQPHDQEMRSNVQGVNFNSFSDYNARRRGHVRSTLPGTSREFRVVRDNRVNQNTNKEGSDSHVSGTSLTETSSVLKPSGGKGSSEATRGSMRPQSRHARDSGANEGTSLTQEKQALNNILAARLPVTKAGNLKQNSATLASTDPVHVPSLESRSAAAVGAIKREVGVVGGRRRSGEVVKDASATSNSVTDSLSGRGNSETLSPFQAITKSGQVSQSSVANATPSISTNKLFLSNQHSSRSHQQVAGHQKVSHANKEWKPKPTQKSTAGSPGIIGTPTKSTFPAEKTKKVELKVVDLEDKFSRANNIENQNVIIAQHIRHPDNRLQLTFGSFGVEFDSSRNVDSGFEVHRAAEESPSNSAVSLSVSSQEGFSNDASSNKEDLENQVRNTGSEALQLNGGSETQLLAEEESSSPHIVENYVDIGLVRDSNPPYAPPDSKQQQNAHEFPSFSAYDPQFGYDMPPYYRATMDDHFRGQGLPPQEALSSHMVENMPASTPAMVQQQQQPQMQQMYPQQVHVSHFANLLPYRQIISPVFVPQMAMPGYSNNPGYPHPSNGSSYVLMPGASAHLGTNGLKYGIQQFKQVPGGSPTGFANYPNPAGYAFNASGVVGSATGLDDSYRMKYKNSNLYAPSPQAEASEVWVQQNPRDIQSTQYYNVSGQTQHPAYLPSHQQSFNAGAAQSSHMQFPGLYHHPAQQPTTMASPHHMGPAMGSNVNAPGPQVGAYQQQPPPQLGHLNWASNF